MFSSIFIEITIALLMVSGKNQSPGTVGYSNGQEIVMKNWKKIAEIGNEQLRLSLISAQGEIAEGLSRGFPQYFLTEGEQQELPTREQLLKVVKEAGRRDEVLGIIKQLGIPHQRFGFSGHCRGSVDGVSCGDGSYNTVRYGYLDNYYRSSKRQGEELEYEGAKWLVVWNGYSPGAPEYPSGHSLVIVPVDAMTR